MRHNQLYRLGKKEIVPQVVIQFIFSWQDLFFLCMLILLWTAFEM